MKRFMLFGLLILITACPVIAIAAIAYENTSVEVNALALAPHSIPVAPAPEAILLGSTAMWVVGWLHRRKKV